MLMLLCESSKSIAFVAILAHLWSQFVAISAILGDPEARFWDEKPSVDELAEGEAVGYAVPLYSAVEEGAVCIDGTTPYYYYAPGSGSGANKYYVYFQGGGWCAGNVNQYGTGFDTCYARSLESLGSSKTYASWLSYGTSSTFDTNSANNPLMYNWNKVYLMYCDGASFGGNKDEPFIANVNGEQVPLYSRGHRILKAVYTDLLKNRGMSSATDIVISGGSAGGLATWLHSDWIYANLLKDVVPDDCRVSALPDSGYFLSYNGWESKTNYSNGLQWVFRNGNMSYGSVNSDCIENYGGQDSVNAQQCVFAQNIAPFVGLPLFALNSQYDSWQTENILGSSNATLINEYGKNFTKLLYDQFVNTNSASSNNNNHGGFIDSCHHHCGDWDAIKYDNLTQATAHYQFYMEKVVSDSSSVYLWFQNDSYPCDSCC